MSEREKGAFPISIGTSLALEGALGIHPDRPLPNRPIFQYREVWLNVYTLFRNLLTCLKAEQQRAATVTDLLPALIEDILGCATVVEQETNGRVKAIFYLNDYSGLIGKYPHATHKAPNTENQLVFAALEKATLEALMRHRPDVPFKQYGYAIKELHPKVLMLTHLPVDLLSRYQFEKLDLLESHTGKIKGPAHWNSKLSGKSSETSTLPFNSFTLQVFGDNVQFVHQLRSVKEAVTETAQAANWSSITTMDKVKMTL
jgi:hypothetical protein